MDDTNSWACSVCTFRNGFEAFKCLMCDVRKGTSTRKPRINPEMVAKQVARQQEQIKQQVLKTAVKPKSSGEKCFRRIDDTNSNSSMASTSSSGRNSPTVTNSSCSNDLDCSNNAANSPSFFDNITSVNKLNTATSSASKSLFTASSSRNSSKLNNFENSVAENGIESSVSVPPNGNQQTPVRKVIAPRVRLTNVDRNDVIVKSVTVNNVTVVITEYKPINECEDNESIDSKKVKDSPKTTIKNNGTANKARSNVESKKNTANKNSKSKTEGGNRGGGTGAKKRQSPDSSNEHQMKKFSSTE